MSTKASFYLNSKDSTGKAIQRSITDINPDANKYQIVALAKGLNALTNNTYVSSTKVIREDLQVDTDDPQFWIWPTLITDVTEGGDSAEIELNYLGDTRTVSVSGEGAMYYNISGQDTKTLKIAIEEGGSGPVNDQTLVITLPETDKYKKATTTVTIKGGKS